MQFFYDRGLTDTGIPRNQYQLRPAAIDNAVEGPKQRPDLRCSTVQFLGNQKLVWYIPLANTKSSDRAACLPFSEATPKITLCTSRRLVAFLGSLGEKPHDNRR